MSSFLLSYHGLSLFFSLSPLVVASGVESFWESLRELGLFPLGFVHTSIVVLVFRRGSVTG